MTEPRPRTLAEPEGRCIRCGRPVPADVSLCDYDNPGHITAPSSTQAHGTILVGVIFGFVLFAIAARFAVAGGAGPFLATLEGRATRPDGGMELLVRVANQGDTDAPATCRVTRDGTPRQTDAGFRTDPIPANSSVAVEHSVPPPVPGAAYDPARLTVVCV